MPSWPQLMEELVNFKPSNQGDYIADKLREVVAKIAKSSDCNVIYYASGFLQKPHVPAFTAINLEDINGFMAGVHDLDFDKDLILILHTPGGMAEAAQTIVDYLRSKFTAISALVPTYAMSAGTMIALGCDNIIMGRQSQLGPTDPQLMVEGRPFSAHSIVEQFDKARDDISNNPVLAHAWIPVLRSFGPALLEEARKSISYGEDLVIRWLTQYMFSDKSDPPALARNVADYFGGDQHGSHGRRIDREAAKRLGVNVIDLEDDHVLQEHVLTLYHLSTIAFERGPALKHIASSNNRLWVKNLTAVN